MSKFKETLNKIKKNKEIRESGKLICIPYPFPRLREVLPGIEKGQHYCVLAGTGLGKSKFARFVYIYSVYNFIKDNPDCGIKPLVFYFLLEDSADKVISNMICYRLKQKYKIDITLQELESKTKILSSDILEKIEECEEYFNDFENYVKIIDHIHNPFGLYKEVRQYLENNGEIHYEEKTNEKGVIEKFPIKYIPNDLERHVIVVVDNLSNITKEEKHSTQWDAIGEWSAKYCRKYLCKFFNATVVNIQQQDLESQKMSYSSFDGRPNKSKVKPSLSSLGDNKTIARDYHVIFGLFNPDRFEFEEDLGYDITILQNNYRNLSILKSNETDANYEIGLYFNGASEQYIELPHSKREPVELNKFYEKFKQKYKK